MDYNTQLLQLPFQDPAYVGQFLRTLGYSYYNTIDVSEVYAIAHRIKENDADSWYENWKTAAEQYHNKGDDCFKQKHYISARNAYLRATEYYRSAHFFLRDNLWDPRIKEVINKSSHTFKQAMALFPDFDVQEIEIPFEDSNLIGYAFINRGETNKPRPTIFGVTGYDSFSEELFQLFAIPGAIERGYNLIALDGPGQGHTLLKNKLFMRPDFDVVMKTIIDWLEQQPYVDTANMIAMGRSFGGYLVPRGLVYEKRVKAFVVDPGQVDIKSAAFKCFPEELLEMYRAGKKDEFNAAMEKIFEDNPVKRFFFISRTQVHGCDNVYDLLREYENFEYRDLASQITTPCLITDNPFDFATRGKELYDCLKNVENKKLLTFVDENAKIDTGGGGHCEQGYNLEFEIQVYNWIADTIGFDEQA